MRLRGERQRVGDRESGRARLSKQSGPIATTGVSGRSPASARLDMSGAELRVAPLYQTHTARHIRVSSWAAAHRLRITAGMSRLQRGHEHVQVISRGREAQSCPCAGLRVQLCWPCAACPATTKAPLPRERSSRICGRKSTLASSCRSISYPASSTVPATPSTVGEPRGTGGHRPALSSVQPSPLLRYPLLSYALCPQPSLSPGLPLLAHLQVQQPALIERLSSSLLSPTSAWPAIRALRLSSVAERRRQ